MNAQTQQILAEKMIGMVGDGLGGWSCVGVLVCGWLTGPGWAKPTFPSYLISGAPTPSPWWAGDRSLAKDNSGTRESNGRSGYRPGNCCFRTGRRLVLPPQTTQAKAFYSYPADAAALTLRTRSLNLICLYSTLLLLFFFFCFLGLPPTLFPRTFYSSRSLAFTPRSLSLIMFRNTRGALPWLLLAVSRFGMCLVLVPALCAWRRPAPHWPMVLN